MVTPSDAQVAVARAIDNSGNMPDETSYLLEEADLENDNANVDLPVVEVQIIEADDVHPNNTDLVDYVVDGDGNRTGRVYYSEYEMVVRINIWTVADGGYDVDELGDTLKRSLYNHSSYGPGAPFVDESGNEIDSIFRFSLESGERQDDLIRTPTVRLWRQEVEVWAYEEFSTTEEYIVDVVPPSHDGVSDDNGDGTLEA